MSDKPTEPTGPHNESDAKAPITGAVPEGESAPDAGTKSESATGAPADVASDETEASEATALTPVNEMVPNVTNISMIASEKPMSPTRLMTKAFLAAAAADGLCCQKPMSRYDARPTPSQPRNRPTKFAERTSVSIAATKRLR